MKFRNPETGEVFDVSDGAPGTGFCCGIRCYDCPIRSAHPYCKKFINDHPHEAARLMGYEVVEEEPTWAERLEASVKHKEEANMDKPLKDWTLGEVKEYCNPRGRCSGCAFFNRSQGRCRFYDGPYHWDLTDRPNFTQQEVEDAKTILKVFGRKGTIKRYHFCGDPSTLTFDNLYINQYLFPSIKPDQEYTLDEIIGGAE